MAIEDWMPALVARLGAIPGVVAARGYDDLPAAIQEFPAIIVLPQSGTQELGGVNVAVHQVRATLFVSAQVLPEAHGLAVPFIQRVRSQIAGQITLGGLVAHCLPVGPPASWYEGPGAIKYGDKELVGINFTLEVKEQETVTVAA